MEMPRLKIIGGWRQSSRIKNSVNHVFGYAFVVIKTANAATFADQIVKIHKIACLYFFYFAEIF